VFEADCFTQPRPALSFGQWGREGLPVRPWLDPPLYLVLSVFGPRYGSPKGSNLVRVLVVVVVVVGVLVIIF